MYFGVLTLLSVNTTVSERPFYIGLTAVSWGLGTVTGPAIGGAFAESNATWRWVCCPHQLLNFNASENFAKLFNVSF